MPSSQHVRQYQNYLTGFRSWSVAKTEGQFAQAPLLGKISDYFQSLRSTPEPVASALQSDTVSVGISPDTSDAEIFIETSDPARIQQLKALGLARGSTPTAYVITFVGEYLQSLLVEAEYHGMITKQWAEKCDIAIELQQDLRALEQEELELDPKAANGLKEFNKRERLREKIIHLIDKALVKNEKLSLSLFSTNGKLHKQLHLARQFIWNYSFPDKPFTKEDQLNMTLPSSRDNRGDKPIFVYQASQHTTASNQQYAALRAFYRVVTGVAPKKTITTGNEWSRFMYRLYQSVAGGMAPGVSLKDPSLVDAMWQLEKSVTQRATIALKQFVKHVPLYVKDSFKMGNYFSDQLASIQSSILQKSETLPFATIALPKQNPGEILVAPSQMYRPVWHDSFLARIGGFLQGHVRGFEEIALQHPVSAVATLASGALSFAAAFHPATLQSLLVKSGMDAKMASGVSREIINILKVNQSKNGFEKFQLSMAAVIKAQTLSQMIADRDVTLIAFNLFAVAEMVALLTGVKLGPYTAQLLDTADISASDVAAANKQQSEAIKKQLAKIVANANMNKAGVFGALIVQPFRFILPILRVFTVPIITAIYQRSLLSGWRALKKESQHTMTELSKAVLAGFNFLFNALDTVVSLSFTVIRVVFEAAGKFLYKPFGTVGTLLNTISDALLFLKRYAERSGKPYPWYRTFAIVPALAGYLLKGPAYLCNQLAMSIISVKARFITVGHEIVFVLTNDLIRLPKFLAHRLYQKLNHRAQDVVQSMTCDPKGGPSVAREPVQDPRVPATPIFTPGLGQVRAESSPPVPPPVGSPEGERPSHTGPANK